MNKHQRIVDDLSKHVMDQALEALHRAIHLVPSGLEAALVLGFFFRCALSTAQILPLDSWEGLSIEDRVRALIKIMESALSCGEGLEISNREVTVVPRRSRRGH